MKRMNYALLRTIFALILGLVLVLFPEQAGDYLVITVGVIFLIPSLISLVGYGVSKAEERPRFPLEGVGSLLFGLWLLIMPGFFANLLTFVLGFVLVMGGVQQLAAVSAARRWMPVHYGYYIVPTLILIAGVVAIVNPIEARSTVFMMIGATALVYAISELVNWLKLTRRKPTTDKAVEDAVILSEEKEE